MRRQILLVALGLCMTLAGCAADPGPVMGPAPALASETIGLHCVGHGGAVPSFEGAGTSRCWHHMGHHLYFLPEARLLRGINGSAFVVEQSITQVADDYALVGEASLDGHAWTPVFRQVYVPNDEDRNAVDFQQAVAGVPFRFVRISVSPSVHEGLAGYLDGSSMRLEVEPPAEAYPEPAPGSSFDCMDGVLESFFAEHPCWFGGLDETDGGAPDQAHTAFGPGSSYYDSPSFLHTYYLGLHPGGPLEGEVSTRGWRSSQLALCAPPLDAVHVPISVLVVTQSSHDGRVWADIARTYDRDGDKVAIQATVPPGTRFIRFETGQGVGEAESACYHSQAFVVDSRFDIGPPAGP